MTALTILHGNPIATIDRLCELYEICPATARTLVREMQTHTDRYGKACVKGEGKLKRVNLLAFDDYWTNRTKLKDKNMKKYVEPYDPQQVAWSLGFYGTEPGAGAGRIGEETDEGR